MQRLKVMTEDGSHSVFVPELNEHYHSIHGAIQESRHVFIENGFNYMARSGMMHLRILEVGLGTGLNAFLSFLETQGSKVMVQYAAVENDPLKERFVSRLNYPSLLKAEQFQPILLQIHRCKWKREVQLAPQFSFIKYEQDFRHFDQNGKYNLVYYDAFAPNVQPEMWEEKVLKTVFDLLEPGGIMVTYCAKGVVKRTLASIGFQVEGLAGPLGKWEMIRASRAMSDE